MKKHLQFLFAVLALTFVSTQTFAYQNGITGRTTSGCGGSGCHSGTSSATTLSVSGTTTVNPSAQTTLTLTIANSSRPRSGCDIDFINSSNTQISGLSTVSGQGMSLSGNELIHSTPKTISGGQSTWQFNVTGPSTPGVYTLRIAGNATQNSSTGDWNTTTQQIVVKGLTLTAPAGGVTLCGGAAVSIQWTSFGVSNVNVQLSSDGGANYATVANTSASNGANSYNYTLPLATPPGSTYRFRVVDAADASLQSAMSSNFTVGVGVTITGQPTPPTQTACQGSNVVYTVTALGASPTFQWRKDGQNVNGATASQLSLNNLATNQAGVYDCVVSSSCGAPATSNSVSLIVEPAAAITTQPLSLTICEAGSALFSINATGNGLIYKWKKNGVDINGATRSSYTVAPATPADAGSYTCVATGSCGPAATSTPANLIVVSPPNITSQPSNAIKCEGASVNFSVGLASTDGVAYEWVKDGVTLSASARITGVTTNALSINSLQLSDAGLYTVRIIATACQSIVNSNAGQLGVSGAPPISTQPQSKLTTVGGSATFSVTATGTGLTYQWKKNGSVINGQTQSSYTIAAAAKTDEGSYTVVVTGTCGNTTSAPATLTVSDQPQPVLSLSTSKMSFGTIKLGAQVSADVEISNTGTAKLDVTGVSIDGLNKASFGTDATSFSLDAKAKKTIKVTFTAGAVGSNIAKIVFASNASGTNELNVDGNGVLRAITPALTFYTDSIEVTKSRDTIVSLCNATSQDVVISSAGLAGDMSSFSFIGVPLLAQLPLTLKKDSCVTVALRFTPTKVGVNAIQISFVTSQGNDTLEVRGNGKSAPASVDYSDASMITLTPNPASDIVRIELPWTSTVVNGLQIVDMLGHGVYNGTNQSSDISLSVASIPSGMYRIIIESNSALYSMPLLIVH